MDTIENFTSNNHSTWDVINDGVMGGLSQSQFQISNNKGIFSGIVSLENNGGFASSRTRIKEIGSNSITSIIIRVNGDGKTYQFRARMNQKYDGIAYRVFFKTKKNEWTEHHFSATNFEAVFRGMKIPLSPKIKLAQIQQIGFLIAEKQEGPFRLEVDWISSQ